jgi:hypothetical protein
MNNMVLHVSLDDGWGNKRGKNPYRGMPLLTEKKGPKLDNALNLYAVLFYQGRKEKPLALAFLDLNPRKRHRVVKQRYRREIADKLIEVVDTLSPQVISACNYFSQNGPVYRDENEQKKYLLQNIKERKIKVKFGKSRQVYVAHKYVNKFVHDVGEFLDWRLGKLYGWVRNGLKTTKGAEEFLSWNNTPVENGVSGKIIITQQLKDYVQHLYDDPLSPYSYLRTSFKKFTDLKLS